ncbi:MAG: hypothetical protein WBB76_07030, partial [Gaiellaceae bacterium]
QPPRLRRRHGRLRGAGDRRVHGMTSIARLIERHGIALLALFVALGGTTYAATGYPAGIIGAKQLKKSAVTNPKIKDGAVTGAKIAINTITGANVLESSLGQVPSATHADSATNATKATTATNAANATNATNATRATNADQLGGTPASDYLRRVQGTCPSNTPIWTFHEDGAVFCLQLPTVNPISMTPSAGQNLYTTVGRVLVQVICHGITGVVMNFDNQGPGAATLNWIYSDGTTVSASGTSLAENTQQTISFSGKRIEGQFIFANGFSVSTVKLHAFDGGTFCEVRGTGLFAV